VAELREITSGLEFPEGPIAMEDGSVLVTEIQGGRITRVKPDGSKETVAECGGGPNGAAIGPDGKLYVTNNGGSFQYIDMGGLNFPHQPPPDSWDGGRIERIDIDSGEVEVIYTECDGNQLRGPNDIVFDEHGGFWFTDHGVRLERSSDRTGIFYAQPDGSSIKEMAPQMDAPNGIGLSPDGSRLYVAETYRNSVWWWPVTGPGEIEHVPGVFPHGGQHLYAPGGLQGFDSLAVDGDGHVCLATLLNPGISVIDGKSGELVEFVQTDDPLTTNICFGGEGNKTAYITLSGTGRLVAVDWNHAGLELAYTA
jgi:gluconolactonase